MAVKLHDHRKARVSFISWFQERWSGTPPESHSVVSSRTWLSGCGVNPRTVRSCAAFFVAAVLVLLAGGFSASADVIINVLAVNGRDQSTEKDIEFSLPGELRPEDVLDAAGLTIDYNVNDAGYYLHSKVLLQPKETKTFRVRVRDVWRVTEADVNNIHAAIESGFKEMGAERSAENGESLRKHLLSKLDYILAEQSQAAESIEQRMDVYRNHLQTLNDIKAKASLIDYWRSDATEEESKKVINYVIDIENPSDKPRKFKQQHYLPAEVKPEYIIDRQGYEIRYDEKKGKPFLFKEEDLQPKEKKSVRIGIRDVWFVPQKDMLFIRERAKGIYDVVKGSKYANTAQTLYDDILNNLDMIDMLQASVQPDIQQHIGAYRINQKRFEKAKEDLDALEKVLSRHRAELEKSKIKNIMQKIQSLRSLARISQAIFDKKPTVNAAWKIIGSVMIFLGLFTIIHFVTWFVRSSKDKKQEEIALKEKESEAKENEEKKD